MKNVTSNTLSNNVRAIALEGSYVKFNLLPLEIVILGIIIISLLGLIILVG